MTSHHIIVLESQTDGQTDDKEVAPAERQQQKGGQEDDIEVMPVCQPAYKVANFNVFVHTTTITTPNTIRSIRIPEQFSI